MLRTVSGQRIKAARAKAARQRQPARTGAAIPCEALDLGDVPTGLTPDGIEDLYAQRAWAYISATDSEGALLHDVRDTFTFELLAEPYETDANWDQLLWYWLPDGTRKVIELPEGWDTGPTSIMRVGSLCTNENGQRVTEYARKAVVLAYFASQRKEHPDGQNGLHYPQAYRVPGSTGRELLQPVPVDYDNLPPEYGDGRFLMNRFLDECNKTFANPDAPEAERVPLYDRSKDRVVAEVVGNSTVLKQPNSPFPSWKAGLPDRFALAATLVVAVLEKALEAMEASPVNTAAQIKDLTDVLVEVRAYWRDDDIRRYLVTAEWERFWVLIGSKLHAVFTKGDRPGLQGKIVDFWHAITNGPDMRAVAQVLTVLKGTFSVAKYTPFQMWFQLAPDAVLAIPDYYFDRRTRALEFASDMLWSIFRPRPVVSEFVPFSNRLIDAQLSQKRSLLEDINTIERLTEVFVDALKTPSGVPPQAEGDRLVAVLVRARSVLKDAPFENMLEKQTYAKRLFMAGLDAWVATKLQPLDGLAPRPTPDIMVYVLRAFNITMKTVVEVVDLDRPGGLFEAANSESLRRYFWTFVVPLSADALWNRYDYKQRDVIANVIRELSNEWGPPPEQLSLPPGEPMEEEEEAPPAEEEVLDSGFMATEAEINDVEAMRRLVRSMGFRPFPSTLSAYQVEAYNAFTTRLDNVELQFRMLTWADRMWEIDTVDGIVPNLEALKDDFMIMAFPTAHVMLKNALRIVNNVLILNEMGSPYTEREQEQVRVAFREAFHAIVNRVNRSRMRPTDYPHFSFLNSVVQKAQGLSYVPDPDAVALALVRHLPVTEPAVEATSPSSSDSDEDEGVFFANISRTPARLRRERSQNDNGRAVRQRTSARYARTLAERLAAVRLSRRA